MKRKIIDELLKWKKNKKGKPLILLGARQVGKTYAVREFAKQNYEYLYEINFELNETAKKIFNGDLTIENLYAQLSSFKLNIPIIEGKTLLFFDEVQVCPNVLTALKTFALDGRFDVITSGSMLGVFMENVSSFPVGYVDTLYMSPMSFEEFLWANGFSEELIHSYETYYKEEKMVPEAIHNKLNQLFLQYIVVGGMPEVVKTFVQTLDIRLVVENQKKILSDYQFDLAHYAKNDIKEKVRDCYDSIPDQLAKENKKFQFKLVKEGGNTRIYNSSIRWIVDAGLVHKVFRLKTFDKPLRAYKDAQNFKLYFNDTGLLLAMYEEHVQFDILNSNLGVFKGAIFENVIAQILLENNLSLYYYRRDNHLEIDFVTSLDNEIVPIEIKAGYNTKSISFNNVIQQKNLKYGIKLSMNNVNCSNPKIKCFPLYMSMFIKDHFWDK